VSRARTCEREAVGDVRLSIRGSGCEGRWTGARWQHRKRRQRDQTMQRAWAAAGGVWDAGTGGLDSSRFTKRLFVAGVVTVCGREGGTTSDERMRVAMQRATGGQRSAVGCGRERREHNVQRNVTRVESKRRDCHSCSRVLVERCRWWRGPRSRYRRSTAQPAVKPPIQAETHPGPGLGTPCGARLSSRRTSSHPSAVCSRSRDAKYAPVTSFCRY
jgi:hypothetical protein